MYRGNGYCALHLLTDLTPFPLHSTADHGRRHVFLTTSQLVAFPATFARPKTSSNFLSTKSQPRDRFHLSGTISMASTTHKAAIAAVARMWPAATSSTKTYASSTTTFSVLSLLHVSRYSPDFRVDSLFRQRLDPQTVKVEKQTLAEINSARLTIGRPGVTDTMYFQQLCEPGGNQAPPAGYVDIEVKAASLNAKGVYAMSGRVETRDKTTGFDFSGVVTAIGPEIKQG